LKGVSTQTLQVLLAALASVIAAAVIVRLARRQLLSFRYTVGWLVLAALGVFAGIAIPLVAPVARALGVSPAALLAVGAAVLVLAISIQLSISISGLQQQNRTLTEELARLRQRIDEQR
jgi:hypothetical protein